MNRLVCIKGDQVMTTSVAMAESFARRHDNVTSNIKKLIDEGVLGLLDFKESSYTNSQNKKQPMYLLTERGFLISMPFIGGSKSKVGQVKLVDEFLKMREALKERQSTQWQESRMSGVSQRRDETDVIAEYLLPLARHQNPNGTYAKKPKMAYANYSKLIKCVLDCEWDSRDELSWQYIRAVEAIERMIAFTIKQQSDINTPYKKIYSECKTNAVTLVELLCLNGKPLLTSKVDLDKKLTNKGG